jgi:hypothetical protein
MRKPDLSKLSFTGGGVPTMIVPPGTQIQVDGQGQVSIRTPGNLVLQNSGSYGVLESVSGSIRIEPTVKVEAVTVRCADTCFVQGSLTAWRLVARTLHVDSDAEAQVVMQETEHLEVERTGRVVGNFKSEKELFSLFSRFAPHVRALPDPLPVRTDGDDAVIEAEIEPLDAMAGATGATAAARSASAAQGGSQPPAGAAQGGSRPPVSAADSDALDDLVAAPAPAVNGLPPADLPDALSLALLLLEHESVEPLGLAQRRVLDKLLSLLRQGDVETLRHTFKTLFARLADGGEGIRRARRAVGAYFDSEAARAAG